MNGKTFYQAFYILIGVVAFFLVGGMVLGEVLDSESTWSLLKPPPRLAVVDMQALITKRSQHLAKTNSSKPLGKGSAKVSSHQIQEAGEQLKETLEAFANKHRLILFSKGAVMGGNLPDYTNDIIEDAFPDYTARLAAFIENKTASQQSKSLKHEGFQFEDLQPKDQRADGQESQP